ncbi:hypothetical protein, partial [Salinisphaera sp. T5B8]|uniref:hypothetical protein n=1 Tax=Salinisphaera sp. T5B8 TaxID=1304154 RepID=UPI003341A941
KPPSFFPHTPDLTVTHLFVAIGIVGICVAAIAGFLKTTALAYLSHKVVSAAVSGLGVISGVLYALGCVGVMLGGLDQGEAYLAFENAIGSGGVALGIIAFIPIVDNRNNELWDIVRLFLIAGLHIGIAGICIAQSEHERTWILVIVTVLFWVGWVLSRFLGWLGIFRN